ncbi:bcl-2 homologous antagonist/killer-like [Crassostrea virginica]
MAYWDGGSGTGEGGRIPPTVSVRQLPTPHSQLSAYDTEEHVVDEAESVTRNFIYESYQLEMGAHIPSSITTLIPELRNVTLDPTSQASIVARKLALIGDKIHSQFRGQFEDIFNQLDVRDKMDYKVFENVTKKLFAKEPNWGRVATLMYFAYFIIMRFAKEKAKILPQFLKDIVSHVVRFIKEKLAGWIARQGGWRAALQYSTSVSVKHGRVRIVVMSCLAIVAIVYFFKWRG